MHPKVAHKSKVLAQVKFKFRMCSGRIALATRKLQLTKKGNDGLEFKSLEQNIKTISNNEEVQLHQKCAQIEKNMSNFLGYSKAVL